MLGNLDNEVIFKKAFTDKIVFQAFVHDILGIDIEVGKIETEKQFEPKVGYVDFKLDIFAESVDKRVVIAIQRVEIVRDPSTSLRTSFDRFLHYFLMTIAEQQKSSEEYIIGAPKNMQRPGSSDFQASDPMREKAAALGERVRAALEAKGKLTREGFDSAMNQVAKRELRKELLDHAWESVQPAPQRTVYVIVVMTAPYQFDTKKGDAVRDEVLLLKLNPKTLAGIERDLYGHQLVCLNPNHPEPDTPPQIRDWLDLIYQSIHSPHRPAINESNPGILRAATLINFDNLTPTERMLAKDEGSRKTVLAINELDTKRAIAKELLAEGDSIDKVMRVTGLSREEIEG